jgi:hypothetical protein
MCRQIGMLVLAISLTLLAGCGSVSQLPIASDDLEDGNQDPDVTSELGKTRGEPNDTFDQALVAVFSADGRALLQGTMGAFEDRDVYLLDAIEPGELVRLDANTNGSSLDVSVGLFDDQQRLVYENDDRSSSGSRALDSYFEFVTRHAGDPYYLVVTHSAFASESGQTGGYLIDVYRAPGREIPPPEPQTLLLNFDGGQVNSPVLGRLTLDPFDSGDIIDAYEGQTERVKELIRTTVIQNFERFDIDVLTSDDPLPADVDGYSIIHFGGFSRRAFGIAEQVDLYNVDCCDDAIIYTESFTPQVFSRIPTVDEIGVAIGNIASHEAGHLLGLNHVDDDFALMDAASPADAFLQDQEFINAPLHEDIMAIGTQDAALLLEEAVGLRPQSLLRPF